LVLSWFLQVVLSLGSQTDWKRIAQITKVEYEALLFGFEFLQSMGMKHVEAFDDLILVV
jgi:hypothetical protein